MACGYTAPEFSKKLCSYMCLSGRSYPPPHVNGVFCITTSQGGLAEAHPTSLLFPNTQGEMAEDRVTHTPVVLLAVCGGVHYLPRGLYSRRESEPSLSK